MNKKIKTTVYIDRKLLKKIKHMIVDRDKTNIKSIAQAVDWGLNKLVERGKI